MRDSQPPSGVPSPECQRSRHSKEYDVDERACGYAPECGCWTWGRVYVRYPAKRPKHDLIRRTAYLTARERMPELVKRDNEEESQILRYVPCDRRVASSSCTDFECRHNKPRPVQKDINSRETKQLEGALASARHDARLIP